MNERMNECIESLGDREILPMQLIPQNSYGWSYPPVVRIPLRIPVISIAIRITTRI